jgi:hypothetical protein
MGIMPFIMPMFMGIMFMPFVMGIMPLFIGIMPVIIIGIIPFIMGIMPMFIGIMPPIGRSASRLVLDIAVTFIGVMVGSPPSVISPRGGARKPRGQTVGGFLWRSGRAFVRVEGSRRAATGARAGDQAGVISR